MYCFFYALAHVPMAEAVLMKLTAPLFIPLVAFLWLGERIPRNVALAVLIGFTGWPWPPVVVIALVAFLALAEFSGSLEDITVLGRIPATLTRGRKDH